VGATNTLPDDPVLAAFADRFLVRLFIDPVADALLEELLETAWAPAQTSAAHVLPSVDRLAEQARAVDLRPVVQGAATAVRRLRHAGVVLSDRRVVRAQRLVAAAAVLDGRTVASAEDLWVLPLIAPSREAQALARDVLGDLIDRARNASLVHAAEEFSRGAQARAERLALTAEKVLGGELDRLRVEATLREIDAGFAADDLPAVLRDARTRLITALQP
jgi:MoxR-like ATPase